MKALTAVFFAVLLLFILIVSPMYLPEQADVVIIGAGAAGMRAALESRLITEKVILLEKMPYPGGNSSRATGGFNAVLTENEIGPYMIDTENAGRQKGKTELIRIMVENSGDALTWLSSLGADLTDRGLLAGHSLSRTYRPRGGSPVGREISSFLYREIINKNIDLRTENKALTIRREDKGLIVDVENRTGREYRIRCGSVVIATGGFGGNPEMVSRFNPALKGFKTTNTAGTTGDFIALTEDLPVKLINLADIQIHPTVEPDFGILITEALRGNGGILVNTRGERFTDEMDFREILSSHILEQKGGYSWLIFDQTVRQSLNATEYYVEKQLVLEAESLPALAEELSLPAANLEKTLEKWNLSVLDGRDYLFGRQDLATPLISPPYYAIKVTPGIHYCMGGLSINGRAEVLDLSDNPIPGLYAAGEATGGIHGSDRLGGNSLTDAMVFGRIAGQNASEFAQKSSR